MLVIGGGRPFATYDFAIGENIADEWRRLNLVREWSLDGVVLSNDEPNWSQGHGAHDGQLFNVAVQGVCLLNNGYLDNDGRGVPIYGGGGLTSTGSAVEMTDVMATLGVAGNFFPLQMFDRKVRPGDELYLGLVATKRVLTNEIRKELLDNSPNLTEAEKRRLRPQTMTNRVTDIDSFWTFAWMPFSSRQAVQGTAPYDARGQPTSDDPTAEPPHKRLNSGFDRFSGITETQLRSLVGAWRVARVVMIGDKPKPTRFSAANHPKPQRLVKGLDRNRTNIKAAIANSAATERHPWDMY